MMETKVTVRRRIVINGKEYHDLDEVPAALRGAYEQAIASRAQGSHMGRITFNGQTYDKPEAMPPEIRALYDAAMASLPTQGTASGAGPGDVGRPIGPSGMSRYLIALLVGAAVLAGLYLLYGR
jgi:hypothetical protein